MFRLFHVVLFPGKFFEIVFHLYSWHLIYNTCPIQFHYTATLLSHTDDCRQQLVRMKVRGTAGRKEPIFFTQNEDDALLDAVRQAVGMPGTTCSV